MNLGDIARGGVWIFTQGLLDAVSFHKLIPLLSQCDAARNHLIRILFSNIGVFLGMHQMMLRVITPAQSLPMDQWKTLLPHLFWTVPLYLICYTYSVERYQKMVDMCYRHLRGKSADQPIAKKVENGLLGTFVWLFLFLQGWLLVNVTPLATAHLKSYRLEQVNAGAVLLDWVFAFLAANVVQWILYAWYLNDNYWIACNYTLDDRIALLETRWVYFLGYGFPLVLLGKFLPFFVNYGLFLLIFPFGVVLACVTDSEHPYLTNKTEKTGLVSWQNMPLPIFYFPRQLTLQVLRLFTILPRNIGTQTKKKAE